MNKFLFLSPFSYTARYSMFTDCVMAEKIFKEKKAKILLATNFQKSEKGNYRNIPTIRIPFLFSTNVFLQPICAVIIFFILLFYRPTHTCIFHLRSQSTVHTILSKVFGSKVHIFEWGILHDEFLGVDREDPLQSKIQYDNVQFSIPGLSPNKWQNFLRHYPLTICDNIFFFSKFNLPIAKKLHLNARYMTCFIDSKQLETKKVSKKGCDIFFLGQLKRRKGYDTVVAVAKKILPKYKNVRFYFCTAQENEVLAQIRTEMKEFKRFIIKVGISHAEKKRLYQQAKIYFMPSTYEGFGLPALEAAFSDTLVVASDVPALNEFLNQENAFLFDYKNMQDAELKLEKAITLTNTQRWKENLKRTAHSFDINTISNFTEKFKEALEDEKRSL